MTEKPPTGSKSIGKAIEQGKDPNADLELKDSATKGEAAVSLRISGASYTQVAKVLGYASASHARSAVERILASAADSPEERDQMRYLTGKRLDRLLQSVMGKALDTKDPQQLAYNARALAIVDRQAKLWGVDAPTQIAITATDEQVSEFVQNMTSLGRAGLEAEEEDILDADVIGEDE